MHSGSRGFWCEAKGDKGCLTESTSVKSSFFSVGLLRLALDFRLLLYSSKNVYISVYSSHQTCKHRPIKRCQLPCALEHTHSPEMWLTFVESLEDCLPPEPGVCFSLCSCLSSLLFSSSNTPLASNNKFTWVQCLVSIKVALEIREYFLLVQITSSSALRRLTFKCSLPFSNSTTSRISASTCRVDGFKLQSNERNIVHKSLAKTYNDNKVAITKRWTTITLLFTKNDVNCDNYLFHMSSNLLQASTSLLSSRNKRALGATSFRIADFRSDSSKCCSAVVSLVNVLVFWYNSQMLVSLQINFCWNVFKFIVLCGQLRTSNILQSLEEHRGCSVCERDISWKLYIASNSSFYDPVPLLHN